VQIFRFDREEKAISSYGSTGLHATRIAASTGDTHLTCLAIAPGGMIGTHPATVAQLFLVVSGEAWVAGPDAQRVPVPAGWGARWEAGELHTSGSAAGCTALAVEGASLALFEPQPPS